MAKKLQLALWLERGKKNLLGRSRFFRGLLRPRITAIDLDGQVLRMVQTIYGYRKTRVTRFAAERLDLASDANQRDPQVMGAAVSQALKRLRWKSSLVVMGIPRAMVVLRTITLPETDHAGELASMVHFQIGKDLPFPIEEAVIDFKVQGQLPSYTSDTALSRAGGKDKGPDPAESQAHVEVLVAAVKREMVQLYQETAAAAGFTLAALGLRSYANARCVEACNLTTAGETVALVSLRPDEVIIDVMEGRFLVFSRVAPVKQPMETPDGQMPAEGEEQEDPTELSTPADIAEPLRVLRFAQAVTIEVVRSLHSYQGTGHRSPVSRVVVAGGTGNENDVVEALQGRLSIPAKRLKPATALGLPESVEKHASGALAVFGLGIGFNDREGLPFDFLKPKRPAAPPQPRRVKVMAAAAAAAAVLVALLFVRANLVNKRLDQQRIISTQLAMERKNAPIYKKMFLQVKAVQDWEKAGLSWMNGLASLSTNLPPDKEVYLSSISLGGQGVVRMAVLAKSGEILAKLEEQLRSAGYTVKPIAISPGPEKSGYNFKSNVEVKLPPKSRPASTNAPAASSPSETTTNAPPTSEGKTP